MKENNFYISDSVLEALYDILNIWIPGFYIYKMKTHTFLCNLYCYFELNEWCLPLTLKSAVYPRKFYWEYFSSILANIKPFPDLKKLLSF